MYIPDYIADFFNKLLSYETLTTGIIVSIFTVIGNMLFFWYKSHKEKKSKIIEQQLKEFLQPLYIIFENYNLEMIEFCYQNPDNFCPGDAITGEPRAVVEKVRILLEEKSYLCNDELHKKCKEFVRWAYSINELEVYNKMQYGDGFDFKVLDSFKDYITKEYQRVKKYYLD